MREPNVEELSEAVYLLSLKNPCEQGSLDYEVWEKAWIKAATGVQVSLSDCLPAFLEGYQAGQEWRTDWINHQKDK